MALIDWTDDFSVNIRMIDDHHKKLIGYLNDLHSAMKEGKGKEKIGVILNDLVNYTVLHFNAEEKLFQEHNYLEYESHKAEHEKLKQKVGEFKTNYENGSAMLTIGVMSFLKDWLNNHILGVDKKYAPFLNSKGVS